MILTIASFKENEVELNEGVRHVTDEVVPAVRGADGLVAGYWAIDREKGERLSVMIWENPDAAAAAWPAIGAAITAARQAAGLGTQPSPDSTSRYELVAKL